VGVGEQDARVISRVVCMRYISEEENILSGESCNALFLLSNYFVEISAFLVYII